MKSKFLSRRKPLLGALAALLGCVGLAQAGTITSTFTGATPSEVVTVKTPTSTFNTRAGLLNFDATTSDIGLAGSFLSFCIDLSQGVSTGKTYAFNDSTVDAAGAGTGMGTVAAQQLSELFGEQFSQFTNVGLTSTRAAAIQVAVWEIVTEKTGVLDVGAGTVSFANNAGVLTLAQTFLNQIDGKGPMLSNLLALHSDTAQDQITQFVRRPASGSIPGTGTSGTAGTSPSSSGDAPTNNVPAPQTAALVLLGLAAMRSVQRRKVTA